MSRFCTGLITLTAPDGLDVVGGRVAEVAVREEFNGPLETPPSVALFVENVNGVRSPKALPMKSINKGIFAVVIV